jgi:hypothetical protein
MFMSTLAERAQEELGFEFFASPNYPEKVGMVSVACPEDRQYVLRCPIILPDFGLSVPDEMQWCGDFIEQSLDYQRRVVAVEQPFAYLTIRHGLVTSETDDEFHVDGFSKKVPHIPEQNYIWANIQPTEAVAFPLTIPEDFDPLLHNIQYLIQDSLPADAHIDTLDEKTIYALDPYVIHRRPRIARDVARTFLRLSLTPIPIDDVNNHVNPAFGNITSDYDGVVEFREKLKRYPVTR